MKQSRLLFLLLIVLLVLSPPSPAAQTTAAQAAGAAGAANAPAKGTASIEGVVSTQEDSHGVRKATITLSPETSTMGEGRVESETDADGHFEFKDLVAGRYRVSVQKANYVSPRRYGQSLSQLVNVGDGQHVKDVAFRLIQAAVLTGRVTDEDGEPMPNCNIMVLRQRYVRGKQQYMFAGGNARTDDRGEFRIHSIGPGRYYVSAGRGFMPPPTVAADSKTPVRIYVPTFYPNATEIESATPIEVRGGEEIPLNFGLIKMETAAVRGAVLTPNGDKALNGSIMISRPGQTMGTQSVAMIHDGTFEAHVVPGRYILTAMVMDPTDFNPSNATTITMPLVVPREGMEGLKLQTAGTTKLTAHLKVEGADVDYEKLRVNLSRRVEDDDSNPLFFGFGNGKTTKEGVSELERVGAGTYDISWFYQGKGLEDHYLKSVTQGGHDAISPGVRVSGDPVQIQVVIIPGAARVEGNVLDADQHPIKSALVVAVPDGERRKRDNGYRTTNTDQNGHFLMRGLLPGRYEFLAMEDPEPGIWTNPEFLKAVENRAVNLNLSENAREQVQLRVVSASEGAAAPQ